jgi:hypothetical protein
MVYVLCICFPYVHTYIHMYSLFSQTHDLPSSHLFLQLIMYVVWRNSTYL